MADEKLVQSRAPGGPHHLLARLAGNWSGTTRTWFEPDKLADESPSRGRIRPALDGRFVVLEYEGAIKGKPLFGMAIIGYHIDASLYTMAWVDSFHLGTATMHSEGEPRENGFSVLGHYDVPQSEPWGWRTELAVGKGDLLKITAYNISPRGGESRAVETIYRRDAS